MDLATYGIIAVALLGAIIGSFLNVVVYRLPIGLSIGQPRWSFCPRCEHRIRPYHNIPVLSWLLLRGRCYDCGVHVSIVYPLVECLTAITFVVVWDALFIAQVVPGINDPSTDWPIALAMGTLFACLLASATMDIEAYTIDIRVPLFAAAVAVVCHAVWGLPLDRFVPEAGQRPIPSGLLPPGLCLPLVAAGATWLVTVGVGRLFLPSQELEEPAETGSQDDEEPAPPCDSCEGATAGSDRPDGEPSPAEAHATQATIEASHLAPPDGATAEAVSPAIGAAEGELTTASLPESTPDEDAEGSPVDRAKAVRPRFQPIPVLLLVVGLFTLLYWAISKPAAQLWTAIPAGLQRGLLACLGLMIALIMTSKVPRQADEEIIEEIEAEREDARRVALHEFAWFIPGIIAAIGVCIFLQSRGEFAFDWAQAIAAYAGDGAWGTHAAGAVHAIACMIGASALGWAVRVLGTLGLGKEALGTGDIYIMAAIGAAGGLWLAGFGFFIAALLALIGVVVMAFWKANRAIPLGPWLALGAMVTLWVMAPLMKWFAPAGQMLWSFVSGEAVALLRY